MKPAYALLLVVSIGLAAPACKSSQTDAAPKASTYDGDGSPKIKFGDAGTGDGGTGAGTAASAGGTSVLGWVALPFKNIVYLPWKFIGGGVKGAGDGVSAGFAKERMPALGIIFSPVNLLTGFFTGAIEGAGLSPGVLGPNDSFGHAMAQTTRHPTSIWWYE